MSKLTDLKIKAETIKNFCFDVYGDCNDGSYEMCLDVREYHKTVKEIKELEEKEDADK